MHVRVYYYVTQVFASGDDIEMLCGVVAGNLREGKNLSSDYSKGTFSTYWLQILELSLNVIYT